MATIRLLLFQVVGVVAITLVLLELLVATAFLAPALSPLPLSLSRYLYLRLDRNVIQVMPECARFDASLTYTLRPGRCVFVNREFSNEYLINSLGVRDDEQSLSAPEIVFIGDSLTMGWGVEQGEAFPAVVEQRTGKRALNAGVSSYGTVRELRMLERIDRSALRHVVIQYSDNDVSENDKFTHATTFTTMDAAAYQRTVDAQAAELRYYPGKYALNLLAQFRSALRSAASPDGAADAAMDPTRQAELFVSVLERSPVDLAGCAVDVIALDPDFVEQGRVVAARSAVGWVRAARFIDISGVTRVDGALFTLDDHPTAVGHQAIASAVVTALGRTP